MNVPITLGQVVDRDPWMTLDDLQAVSSETTEGQPPLQTDGGPAYASDQRDQRVEVGERDGCLRHKGHKHRGHRRVRSLSLDQVVSPRHLAKGKKKKRKSERKRCVYNNRTTGSVIANYCGCTKSPSYSLSPPRKKKKRKKSSKRSKRHRYSYKKSKHSSSSLRHKKKDERKHKKSSRSRPHRRHRHRRSESDSSSWRSSAESRYHLHEVEEHDSGREECRTKLNQRDLDWRPAVKSVCNTAPQYVSALSNGTILPLQFGDKILDAKGNHGHHDYDSGNDTSSPPSNKNSISQPSGIVDSSKQCQGLASPDKLKITERDNASDSGNSVTSYASLCNPLAESSTFYDGTSKALNVEGEDVRPRKRKRSKLKRSRSSRRRRRERSVRRSPSRNFSCGSSTHTGHSSRSRSLSFCSSYSRSPSSSDACRQRGSMASTSSRDSYCRYSPDRPRDRKRSSNYKEKKRKRRNKERRRKSRRKSYSPMRKRRRDSPSHLEARRITSARKRPIPYFRPSPSSSCRSTSVSSWSSIFTRGRSLTSGHCYRSNSRSSSWNSIFGTRSSRSRSPSYVRLKKSSKTRR
ncbi:serine/arginine repetitive matrix protein 4-like [Gadus chalcogrammus]|uniref:serine/arginine repetitive matrix protein 4-like n=1 Tax=Gadus chalcogrammus TaxID=1042646 RepID=UPI0024C4E5C4|nr:serine/arginine repetitive matrix protein 4-like [Gadus chalcogrammus]